MLGGFAKFLTEKDLALPKQRPYMVRWVREFLLFAREQGGYTFEQTLDLYVAEVGARGGIKPWQIQQATDAVRIYRYQYRGASDDGEGGGPAGGLNDDGALLARLREVIRLRHYAKSTAVRHRLAADGASTAPGEGPRFRRRPCHLTKREPRRALLRQSIPLAALPSLSLHVWADYAADRKAGMGLVRAHTMRSGSGRVHGDGRR